MSQDAPVVAQQLDERGVLTVTIDRPDARNAVNPQVNRELLDALRRADADEDEIRVVVLTGAGDKAFCAGGDLAGMRMEAGKVAQHQDRALFGDVLLSLRRCRVPVVGRINGHAVAGGFGLALACDLLVTADHATFGTPEVKRGLWPYMITTVIADHLGPKRTLELMMLGERFDAAQVAEWGLVNRVVPADRLDEATDELVEALLGSSTLVLSLGKEAYHRSTEMRRDEALAYLASMLSLHGETEDVAEGLAAFFEKREPRWRNR